MQQRPLVLSQSYHKFSHRMHRRPSPRFPPSSDPRPLFLNLSFGAVQNPQSQSHPAGIDVASFRAGILRSKVGRRLFAAQSVASLKQLSITTLLNVSGLKCDAENISYRRRTFRLRFGYNFSHPGCEKPKNSAKRNTKKRSSPWGQGIKAIRQAFNKAVGVAAALRKSL
jgi:hypothetical protein